MNAFSDITKSIHKSDNYPDPLLQKSKNIGRQVENIEQAQHFDDLSNLTITSDGIFEESYKSVENILSRIIEINEKTVILECITDLDNKQFENREFDKDLLEGVVSYALYQKVLIKICKRGGECKFQFINGERLIDSSLFEIDYFKNLINVDIFSKKY